jgi:hypothetical protein
VPARQRGSGVLAIRDVVAAGDSLTPLESLLNRSHPGRVRRLAWRRLRGEHRKASAQRWMVFRKINPDAAGIDVGNATVINTRLYHPVRSMAGGALSSGAI